MWRNAQLPSPPPPMQCKDGSVRSCRYDPQVIVPAMTAVPASYRSTSGWLPQG